MIDLFCGLGGFHLAFEGVAEVILSSDSDPHAQEIYKKNFPLTPLRGDIRDINEKK